MKSQEFRGVLHAQPFRPFTFTTTADGANYAVDALEDAWLAPDGEVVAVTAPGGVVLVGIEWITRVAFTPDPPGLTGPSERLRDLKGPSRSCRSRSTGPTGVGPWSSRRITS